MAFEVVNNQVIIDSIMDSNTCIGVIVNLSENIDKAIVMFDLLYWDKVTSIYFDDPIKKLRVSVRKGKSCIRFDSKIAITLPERDIDLIIDMMLNVTLGLGFPGYHYDVETTDNASTELCFIFQ